MIIAKQLKKEHKKRCIQFAQLQTCSVGKNKPIDCCHYKENFDHLKRKPKQVVIK